MEGWLSRRRVPVVAAVAAASIAGAAAGWAAFGLGSGGGATPREPAGRTSVLEEMPDAGGTGPAGAAVQGITVHGHWIIEVREPDGTLVSRREFENALTAIGGERLAQFLAREQSVGNWMVEVGPNADGPCVVIFPASCFMVEADDDTLNVDVFRTLVVSEPDSGPHAFTLLLEGNVTAQRDGSISTVKTSVGFCGPDAAPESCNNSNGGTFTSRDLDAPIAVSEGQQVLVTVVISFS